MIPSVNLAVTLHCGKTKHCAAKVSEQGIALHEHHLAIFNLPPTPTPSPQNSHPPKKKFQQVTYQ